VSEYRYPGAELEVFARARNWKSYLRARVGPYLRGNVLEVGAALVQPPAPYAMDAE